jgi:hypothetical protein
VCQNSLSFNVAKMKHRGYFTSDNEPDGIDNATHNTFAKQIWIWTRRYPGLLCKCNVGCIFNSVGLVKCPVHYDVADPVKMFIGCCL